MMKYIVLLTCSLALATGALAAQDVVIQDFPLGIAGSIGDDFFQPYHADLATVAQTLQADRTNLAVITGCADGEEYRKHHDAMNPGLALGRAHAMRNYLVREFNVNPDQLLVQSDDVEAKGGQFRSVTVRVVQPNSDLASRVAALENRPPVETRLVERVEPVTTLQNDLALRFGLGLSSSPYGGVPTASAAVVYKKLIAGEVLVGHTFWNNNFDVFDLNLRTKRRMIGGYLEVSPDTALPISVIAGWMRIEEISQQYYEYVRLSEGPLLGVRVMAFPFLSVTAAYNPVKQRQADLETSTSDDSNFILSISSHISFGGRK